MSDSNTWLTKKLAVLGIIYTALISIGASYLGAGISILYTIPPLISEYSKINATKYDYSVVNALTQSATFFFWFGLLLILLSVVSVIIMVYFRDIKIRINHRSSTSPPKRVSGTNEENDYTGNRYFHTRKRLAYHPPDKQFKD